MKKEQINQLLKKHGLPYFVRENKKGGLSFVKCYNSGLSSDSGYYVGKQEAINRIIHYIPNIEELIK
jgi:hypothetical protein